MENKGITREELITSVEFVLGRIQQDLYENISDYLESTGKSRTQFAEDLNVSKGYVSQILNGEFNHRLEKFVELYLSIGMIPIITPIKIENYLAKDRAIQERQKKDLSTEEKDQRIKPTRGRLR